MAALESGFLDRPVHSFDLAVRPGMFDLGKAVLDPILVTDPIGDVVEGGVMNWIRLSVSTVWMA